MEWRQTFFANSKHVSNSFWPVALRCAYLCGKVKGLKGEEDVLQRAKICPHTVAADEWQKLWCVWGKRRGNTYESKATTKMTALAPSNADLHSTWRCTTNENTKSTLTTMLITDGPQIETKNKDPFVKRNSLPQNSIYLVPRCLAWCNLFRREGKPELQATTHCQNMRLRDKIPMPYLEVCHL